ncbi:MAG: ribonuclease HI family protein [Myxococcaceae bacterium]|nr:ribonuclease HI family protein [Myxococcaceae bacterium]
MPRALKLRAQLRDQAPTEVEVLRFIAKQETLASTLEAFPSLDREQLTQLIERVAATLEPGLAKTLNALPRLGTPAPESVRVYTDGAARGNPGPSGAGAVLVDPSGQVVDQLGKFLGTQTNNYAEYMGLLIGLRRARALGVREVEVYADSELMIRQLGGRYQVKSASLKPLYDEAVRLLNDFSRVKLVHLPRAMNKQADEMSNRAIDERL